MELRLWQAPGEVLCTRELIQSSQLLVVLVQLSPFPPVPYGICPGHTISKRDSNPGRTSGTYAFNHSASGITTD